MSDLASDNEKVSYLADDEDLFADIEDDEEVVQDFIEVSTSTEKASGSVGSDLITEALAKLGMKEIDDLEAVNYNVQEFPKEYRFLLDLPAINDQTLSQYPKLFDLLSIEPRTIWELIDKQVAVICLYWVQGIFDCSRPLLTKVKLKLSEVTPIPIKRKSGLKKQFFKIRFYVEYGAKYCKGREPKQGMMVFFRTKDERKILTRISTIEAGKCYFVLRAERGLHEIYMKLENEVVNVFEILQEFLPVSMTRSVEALRTGFLNHILSPQPKFSEERYKYIERKAKQMKKLMKKYDVSDQLTSAQEDAIFAICNKEHNDCPYLVWGPPGTGKTFVISEAIQTLLKMDDSNRVLVCTPSNMAADHVAEQLMKGFGGVLNNMNVLRLRSLGNSYYARDNNFDEIISCDTEQGIYTIPKCFDQWRVVICTLGCSTYLTNTGILTGFFSHMFIDEAGQCSEPELWIPLGGLATPETSVILCGDPKQLGPVITLDLSDSLKKKLTSPLVRYMENEQYQSDTRLCCQLVDCFRCHRSLVGIVSVLFYDKKLLPMGSRHVNFDFAGLGMKADFPILFVSVNGTEKLQPRGSSYANFAEANVCLDYANFLMEKCGVSPEQIGIISPYTYQTKVIIDRAAQRPNSYKFKKVTVASVEKFQGSEREIIIISGTRTEKLGFMADDLRVNTSLTRAKKILIVVGNEYLLQQHDSWRRFISYCKYNNSFKVWEKDDPTFETDGF